MSARHTATRADLTRRTPAVFRLTPVALRADLTARLQGLSEVGLTHAELAEAFGLTPDQVAAAL